MEHADEAAEPWVDLLSRDSDELRVSVSGAALTLRTSPNGGERYRFELSADQAKQLRNQLRKHLRGEPVSFHAVHFVGDSRTQCFTMPFKASKGIWRQLSFVTAGREDELWVDYLMLPQDGSGRVFRIAVRNVDIWELIRLCEMALQVRIAQEPKTKPLRFGL